MDFFIGHIYPWLRWTSILSPVLPLVIGLWLIRKQKNKKFMLLLLFITIGVLTEAVSLITVWSGTKNNLWLGHVYTLLGFSVLAGIFYYSFDKLILKRSIIGGIVGLCLLIYYDSFMADGIMKMNSVSRIAANAMLIMMAITYFYKVANNAKIIYLDRDPMFLLSCTILIYYAGTSMSYAIFNEALAISYDTARICLAIIFVLNVLFYSSQAFILKRMAA
ncbi:hypothetical protein [Pontibacter lucknowensis]|uniref:YhhN-like protein n=1 Tax=Pontibacter lucknowensis TaxID=1077936 RepID=A0A1N6YDJ3_9BACT|nr:hypothetical protein [Pontibacter lucknowensis]SIR12559.1 hypothetical protein SAMN05421545_2425 [Pontibacter lucknowensis]